MPLGLDAKAHILVERKERMYARGMSRITWGPERGDFDPLDGSKRRRKTPAVSLQEEPTQLRPKM